MQNITNIYGRKGEDWISNLPNVIAVLTRHWNLSHVIPVSNMTFNYVAKTILSNNHPAILKISCDVQTILDEKRALMQFDGNGSIELIDFNDKYNALLLQQAVPGISLKKLYLDQVEYVMDCYVDTMKKLHNKCLPNKHEYRHIADWLIVLDHLTPDQMPAYILKRAMDLRDTLLSSMGQLVFLHGDLHHDNILKHNDSWLAIDPKGIVGEPEFEIAAFDFMYITELANTIEVKKIFESRVAMLAQKSNLDAQRIKDWVFVRLILMAAWLIEDNGDPNRVIKLAQVLI
ncbi:MAG: aminoglycoside phosphotransferase [Gammaproteobacteria bacterium]|nr:aminoglycoside phosphotransferase [Gammaproteobacteria bacterium]MCW5582605.1 aminoglycoside phosphotransferase [Gammaproteobacteria bacterium]